MPSEGMAGTIPLNPVSIPPSNNQLFPRLWARPTGDVRKEALFPFQGGMTGLAHPGWNQLPGRRVLAPPWYRGGAGWPLRRRSWEQSLEPSRTLCLRRLRLWGFNRYTGQRSGLGGRPQDTSTVRILSPGLPALLRPRCPSLGTPVVCVSGSLATAPSSRSHLRPCAVSPELQL